MRPKEEGGGGAKDFSVDQSTKERANTVAWLAICTFSQIQLPLISLHREKKPFSSRKEEREENKVLNPATHNLSLPNKTNRTNKET